MADPHIKVTHLTRRLAETPREFLGQVMTAAVLSDVLHDLGHEPLSDAWLASLDPAQAVEPAQRAWQHACAVVGWLLADPLVGSHIPTTALLDLLGGDLHALTSHVEVQTLLHEDDRREELARLLLRAAQITPHGETAEQAADRLETLDTVSRLRVIAESRAAEEHTRTVREALARKRAAQAAAKAMRE